jgi:hypothetical protein
MQARITAIETIPVVNTFSFVELDLKCSIPSLKTFFMIKDLSF